MSAKKDNCRVAQLVNEYIIKQDCPESFVETLDLFFQDAIGGNTFHCVEPNLRSHYYVHYRMLRDFLQELKNTA